MTDASAKAVTTDDAVDTAASGTTRLLASLRQENGAGVVHLEDVYDADIDDLWSAITDPSRLGRWAAKVEGEPRVGGEFRIEWVSGWEGTGRVEVCEAPHHLRITTWSDEDAPAIIDATLVAEGDRTRLIVENIGLRLGDYHVYASGWQAHLEDLGRYFAGRAPSDWAARTRELSPEYAQLIARQRQVGDPAAARPGPR